MTVLIAPEYLYKLEDMADDESRHKLGEAFYWQCFLALIMLRGQQAPLPPSLRRRRPDAVLKLAVSIVAKRIHLFVKNQLRDPTTQTLAFRRALQTIRDTYTPSPRAIDVTAWFAEHFLTEQVWTYVRLRCPTADPDRFARTYLYTPPKLSEGLEPLRIGEALVERIVATIFPA
jgi:hypothetical protein